MMQTYMRTTFLLALSSVALACWGEALGGAVGSPAVTNGQGYTANLYVRGTYSTYERGSWSTYGWLRNTTPSQNWILQGGSTLNSVSSASSMSGRCKIVVTKSGNWPQQYVDMVVTSTANCGSADPPTALTPTNGFDDAAVVAGMHGKSCTGKHLVRIKLEYNATSNRMEGEYMFPSDFGATSTTAPAPKPFSSYNCVIAFDPRFAKIYRAGHPDNYHKKTGTRQVKRYDTEAGYGHDPVGAPNENWWDYEYTDASRELTVPISVGPYYTVYTANYGLPMLHVWRPQGGSDTYEGDVWSDILYEADVYQNLISTEEYHWRSDAGDGPYDYLQCVSHGWDILGLERSYVNPQYIVLSDGLGKTTGNEIEPQAVDEGDTIEFDYKWADGLSAKCQMTVKFHTPTDNLAYMRAIYDGSTIGQAYRNVAAGKTWTAFQFAGSTTEHAQHNYAAGIEATVNVVPQHADAKVEQAIQSILWAAIDGMMPPGWSMVKALYAAGAGLSGSENAMTNQTYNMPRWRDADSNMGTTTDTFTDAWSNGRVDSTGGIIPAATPQEKAALCLWFVEALPLTLNKPNVADAWDADGYVGQKFGIDSQPLAWDQCPWRWHYWYTGNAQGGGQMP